MLRTSSADHSSASVPLANRLERPRRVTAGQSPSCSPGPRASGSLILYERAGGARGKRPPSEHCGFLFTNCVVKSLSTASPRAGRRNRYHEASRDDIQCAAVMAPIERRGIAAADITGLVHDLNRDRRSCRPVMSGLSRLISALAADASPVGSSSSPWRGVDEALHHLGLGHEARAGRAGCSGGCGSRGRPADGSPDRRRPGTCSEPLVTNPAG